MSDRFSPHRVIGGPSWPKCSECGAPFRRMGHQWGIRKCPTCRGKEGAERLVQWLWRKAWSQWDG